MQQTTNKVAAYARSWIKVAQEAAQRGDIINNVNNNFSLDIDGAVNINFGVYVESCLIKEQIFVLN